MTQEYTFSYDMSSAPKDGTEIIILAQPSYCTKKPTLKVEQVVWDDELKVFFNQRGEEFKQAMCWSLTPEVKEAMN